MHDAAFSHEHRELYDKAIHIEGIEQLTLTSVGIDIGSSTTHLIFSRLTLRREGAAHSALFKITDRRVLWSSPILLTPYISKTLIDFDRIKSFFHDAYHSAGFSADDIDTGAVVITGEALKKENAQPISKHFSRDAGKFICASAGPHHEALLAAYGSGAVQLSASSNSRILNIDMGGGTTKFSLIENGKVISTSAINIGARLIAFGPNGTVLRVEDAGALISNACGLCIEVGGTISRVDCEAIGRYLGEIIIDIIAHGSIMGKFAHGLMITPLLDHYAGIDGVDYLVFSGGVAEYIYGQTTASFGDLGSILGSTIRDYINTLPPGMVLRPTQSIRATVIGASEYTVQVSGATSYFTSTKGLPAFGLKAVAVAHDVNGSFKNALAQAFLKYDIKVFGPELAISLSITGPLNYNTLREIAAGLADMVAASPLVPLYLTVEQDVARALGSILKSEFMIANELISIDGITVGDLDYIDIGKPLSLMDLFPVTVKSLLFSPQPTH